MNIALLTSSRADYGIYRPLLFKLAEDPFFNLEIIAFGTHLSGFHGYTVDAIVKDQFKVAHRVESLILGDTAEAIATAIGTTALRFASLWAGISSHTDLIICLGDRYEMFAAVSAALPFNIPVAHLHGGEITLGAIDNSFRHSLTVMSKYHFTATMQAAQKVVQLTGSDQHVYAVGALSLDNLHRMEIYDPAAFRETYGINMGKPSALITFHPETVDFEHNKAYTRELLAALAELEQQYQLVITMPNADTMGNYVRQQLINFSQGKHNIHLIESFGTKGYFSAMKYCSFLLGNTSSGIIEAASFGKYVINLGDRQKGREAGENVLHVPIEKSAILAAVKKIEAAPAPGNDNLYGEGKTADQIAAILKNIFTHG